MYICTTFVRMAKEVKKYTGGFAVAELSERWTPGQYAVTNILSRQSRRVVYYGVDSEWNYCDCSEFRATHKTCKHIDAVRSWLEECGKNILSDIPQHSSLRLSHSNGRRLRLHLGSIAPSEMAIIAMRYFDDDMYAVTGMEAELPAFIEDARKIDPHFYCYPDALNHILEARDRHQRKILSDSISDNEIATILREGIEKQQISAIRTAFENGRTLVAQAPCAEKAIVALGTAELMRQHNMIGSILVICPTSLKYQWEKDIERFTGSETSVVEGIHTRRRSLYNSDATYKIVSYHTLANDIKSLDGLSFDFVVMDEVHRLEYWSQQISQATKRINADYCVALSSTPVINNPEDFYAVCTLNTVKDDSRLYMTLCVPMTKEQRVIHNDSQRCISQLTARWKHNSFLSEKDRKRLLWNIGQMRMSCDSTALFDKKMRSDAKPAEAVQYISSVISWNGGKCVVFSRWERMARIMGEELEHSGISIEYLNGTVPAGKRRRIIENFNTDQAKHVLVCTDSSCRGLELSNISHVINLDQPWTASGFERRMACIGNHKGVQVVDMVSATTIEEWMLASDAARRNIFDGLPYDDGERITLDDSKLDRLCDALIEVLPDSNVFENAPVADSDEQALPTAESNTDIAELLRRGVNIFGEIAKTLQTSEGVEQLVDSIVHTDSASGKSELRIPIENKRDVAAIINLITKILGR